MKLVLGVITKTFLLFYLSRELRGIKSNAENFEGKLLWDATANCASVLRKKKRKWGMLSG